jgi:FkbM family methyltransferase
LFYSQFGEDKILFEIFQKKTNGLCVEVWANNGIDDSTSFFFEQIGWKCILVEPNPFLCQKIRKERNALLYECAASNRMDTETLYVVEGAERSDGLSTISNKKEIHDKIKSHGFVSSPIRIKTMTLDRMLQDAHIDCEIDFISIDVEGHEYEVLEGFTIEQWNPAIVLIEDNSNFENVTVKKYLKKHGYVRFMRTGVNDWYAYKKNKQFVNVKTKTRTWWLILTTKTSARWSVIESTILALLRRVPLLVKIKNLLRLRGKR